MTYHKDEVAFVLEQYDLLNVRSWPYFPIEMTLDYGWLEETDHNWGVWL
jgi:hypothetical protein